MAEQRGGVVSHYFGKLSVAAVEFTDGELRVGDTIHVKGHPSDFTQIVGFAAILRRPAQRMEATPLATCARGAGR